MLIDSADPASLALSSVVLLLKAATVLGAAWVLVRVSFRASAAVRHGIWSLAMLAVLSLPVVDRWIPALHVGLPAPLNRVRIERPVSAPGVDASRSGVERAGEIATAAGGVSASPLHPLGAPPQVAAGRDDGMPLSTLLLVAWFAGMAARLAWILLLSVRTHQLTRDARPAGANVGPSLARAAAHELGVRRPVRVLRSPMVSMPVAWGVVRPVVILPDAAHDWPEDRVRIVLLHELAHIRRWDYLTSLLAELACAIYWPVPLVWLARKRLKFEQEQACDDRVLATGTASLEYAEHLLAVARDFYGNRTDLGLAVAMAREASLKHRIRAILDGDVDRRPLRSRRGLIVSATLLAFFLTVAAVSSAEEAVEVAEAASDSASEEPLLPILDAVPAAPEQPLAPVFLWVEAEEGATTGAARTDQSLDASGAAFLVLRPRERAAADGSALEAGVNFEFRVDAAAEYRAWARVRHGGNGAVLLTSLDGAPAGRWELPRLRGWEWIPVPVGDSASADLAGIALTAGVHRLGIVASAGEVRVDRVLITSDAAFSPVDLGAREPGFRAVYTLLEAEAARLGGRFRQPGDDRASAGEYVVFSSERRGTPAASATFSFDVDQAGRYIVWGRASSPDRGSNSLFVSVNGTPEFVWDVDLDDRSWAWDPMSARGRDRVVDPFVLELSAGRNVIDLRTREDGVRLDALLVTNDLSSRPRGLWPAAIPSTLENISIEPETALIDGRLGVATRTDASGGGFLQVDEDMRGPVGPGEAGSAHIRFTVTAGGLYSLWGRTIARDDARDSFWLRLDGGDWIRWNDIPKGEIWRWSAVEDTDGEHMVQFLLKPGEHVLDVAGREGGAMLDRLLLTNDPLFDPADLD